MAHQHCAVALCWGALMLSCCPATLATIAVAVAGPALQQTTVLILNSTLAGRWPPSAVMDAVTAEGKSRGSSVVAILLVPQPCHSWWHHSPSRSLPRPVLPLSCFPGA